LREVQEKEEVMAAAQTIPVNQLAAWGAGIASNGQAANRSGLWRKLTILLVSETRKNFTNATSPDGAAWRPLRGYRVRGGSRILRDRGLLLASVAGRGAGHVEKTTQDSLEWGTNLDYAATHQVGATILPRNGRALAIPRTREAYNAGSPRRFPKPLSMVWPRGRSSGMLVETRTGAGGKYAANRGARSIIHYLLVPKVTIPARPFIGLNAAILDKIDLIVGEHVAKEIAKA
jgi:phage gpG-like protein